jgi:hypothetical protein
VSLAMYEDNCEELIAQIDLLTRYAEATTDNAIIGGLRTLSACADRVVSGFEYARRYAPKPQPAPAVAEEPKKAKRRG